MKKCVVVGGGLAGLSAAVYLAKAGNRVTLLEASSKLGEEPTLSVTRSTMILSITANI